MTYDKGGWVMWMLHDLMGHDQAIAGLQSFVEQSIDTTDHPVLQDLVEALRPFAPDPEAFQGFVDQWFFDVVVPEYRLSDAALEEKGSGYRSQVTIENVGTGVMPVEVAATIGERFADETGNEEGADDEEAGGNEPLFREVRQTVTLGPGQSATIELESDFRPEQFIVDPDARVLQLRRKFARLELDG